MKETDVVIIGAGPAGSTCANLLKEADVDCVLVDAASFPREKLCGGGLTPKAWHLLDQLMPDLKYDYQPIRKIKVTVEHKPAVEVEAAEDLRIVKRKDFDNVLLQRYLKQGGTFMQEAFSRLGEQDDGKILVTMHSGTQILCNYLVAADGANSRVRRQLLGPYNGNTLFVEQYVEKGEPVIEIDVSKDYEHGYYYRFPSVGFDAVGVGGTNITTEGFRKLLSELNIPETKIRGANIPVEMVESGHDNIILIGDAGGFANKLTYEGLSYAIATGRNASIAITKGIPFREANRLIFKKKKKEKWLANMFYTSFGRWAGKVVSKRLIKWIYDKGVSGKL